MKHRYYFVIIPTIFMLAGCKSPEPLNRFSSVPGEVRYSVIYLIHADADYLYHDENGNPHRADKKVLNEAKKVGEHAESGEIFIYHLKPETKILWLFPRKDRRVLHYRNGELLADRKYSPNFDAGLFKAESDFYGKNRVNSVADPEKILLYFGHEIPSKNIKGYHKSVPNVEVDTESFTKSIQSFLTNNQEDFDLAVLSTCNNGTPQMVNLLNSFTRYLLASPQNLHLSHIDSDHLLLLEQQDYNIKDVAINMAEQTFQRLSQNLQTAITLTVYDLDEVNSYMSSYYDEYRQQLSALNYNPFQDNVDCTQLSVFEDLKVHNGLSRWYQPAQFGRGANLEVHSGWGCKSK